MSNVPVTAVTDVQHGGSVLVALDEVHAIAFRNSEAILLPLGIVVSEADGKQVEALQGESGQ